MAFRPFDQYKNLEITLKSLTNISCIVGTIEICGICGGTYQRHLNDRDVTICNDCMEDFDIDFKPRLGHANEPHY